MRKKIRSLEDLYNFYAAQGTSQKFDYEQVPIAVSAPGTLLFESKDSASATEGLFPVQLKMCFVGDNLNGSRIEAKAMKNALSSAKYRPILGYIHEVDGEPQFYGHNAYVDENNQMVYEEIPLGVITEAATLQFDEENQKDYAISNGYIYEEYSKAVDILKREESCSVSVELTVRSLSYDAKDKVLNLDDFYFSGCTVLGKDDNGQEVKPAMPGSNITFSDFTDNDSVKIDENKMFEILERIEKAVSKFNIDNSEKGGTPEMNHFEELLTKYGKTAEEITFAYEGLSDEELDAAFAEAFSEEDPEPQNDEFAVKYSVTCKEQTKDFSISLNDKIFALQSLVNDTYGELDCDWYSCDVYDDEKDKFVVMHGWNHSYRQQYKVKKDNYSLIGDRVEVFATWLTQDEQNKLDSMKSNYSVIESKLAQYEAEPEKMQVLESEDYEQLADNAEFAELAKPENHFELTKEEIKEKADAILFSVLKDVVKTFSVKGESAAPKKQLAFDSEDTQPDRYGGLFD